MFVKCYEQNNSEFQEILEIRWNFLWSSDAFSYTSRLKYQVAGCRWVIWVRWVCYHIITWLAFTKDSVVRNYIVVKNTTDRLPHSEIPNWFRQARVDASGRIYQNHSPVIGMLTGCLVDYSRRGERVTAHARSLVVSVRMRKGSRSRDVSVAPTGGGLCEECDWFSCSHGSIVVAESLSVCNWFSI